MLEDMIPKIEEVNSCKVVERVRNHPDTTEKDVELVLQYLDDPRWGSYSLATALVKKGISVHKDSVIRHREGRCPCSKQSTR